MDLDWDGIVIVDRCHHFKMFDGKSHDQPKTTNRMENALVQIEYRCEFIEV